MLEIKMKNGEPSVIIADGTRVTITIDLVQAINGIYMQFLESGHGAQAEGSRKAVIMLVNRPDSPLWNHRPDGMDEVIIEGGWNAKTGDTQ